MVCSEEVFISYVLPCGLCMRFERANQGTLFLDEIGDLPLEFCSGLRLRSQAATRN
jgi:transcriptional regulator of acetoin/glycerol metabolism